MPFFFLALISNSWTNMSVK